MSSPTDRPAGAICRLTDLEDGEGRRLRGPAGELFVVRQGRRAYAYDNRCPHEGKRLDKVRNRFMTFDGRHIKCAHHGAIFRIEDGAGLGTPCFGQSLTAWKTTVISGWVVIDRKAGHSIVE